MVGTINDKHQTEEAKEEKKHMPKYNVSDYDRSHEQKRTTRKNMF